jgi:hypothetical protein
LNVVPVTAWVSVLAEILRKVPLVSAILAELTRIAVAVLPEAVAISVRKVSRLPSLEVAVNGLESTLKSRVSLVENPVVKSTRLKPAAAAVLVPAVLTRVPSEKPNSSCSSSMKPLPLRSMPSRGLSPPIWSVIA